MTDSCWAVAADYVLPDHASALRLQRGDDKTFARLVLPTTISFSSFVSLKPLAAPPQTRARVRAHSLLLLLLLLLLLADTLTRCAAPPAPSTYLLTPIATTTSWLARLVLAWKSPSNAQAPAPDLLVRGWQRCLPFVSLPTPASS